MLSAHVSLTTNLKSRENKRPRGKESTEVRTTQKIGKESENSPQNEEISG